MAILIAHLPDKTLPHDVDFEPRDVGEHDLDLDARLYIVIATVARSLYEAHGVKNALTELPEAQA
jgi:hypothetical protein